MNERQRLSEIHYKAAEKLGIPRHIVNHRFKYRGYSVARAISDPVGKRGGNHRQPEGIRKLRHANGVSNATYQYRVRNGMTPEEAATKPVRKRAKS